jgi:hypothetical protein
MNRLLSEIKQMFQDLFDLMFPEIDDTQDDFLDQFRS